MTDYNDENGFYYSNYRDYVFTELLDYCGCYDQDLYDDIFKVLLAYDVEIGQSPYVTDLGIEPQKYAELILHDLNRIGLLEHGSAVRASWVTDEGREVIKKIKEEISRANNE